MKGFQQKAESNGKFFVIKHYCICQESSKEREGYEPIEVVNPQTKESTIKFIKKYDALEAMITKIEWRDTEDKYDQRYMSWKVYLKTTGETGVLELPFNSRVGSRFMKLAENINYSKPVEFRVWRDVKSGKADSTAFFVGQRENEEDEKSISVPQKYTRDNPGKCPEPVQKFGGKLNFDDQMEFLHGQMINVVIPKVEAVAGMNSGPAHGDDEDVYLPPGSGAPSDDDEGGDF